MAFGYQQPGSANKEEGKAVNVTGVLCRSAHCPSIFHSESVDRRMPFLLSDSTINRVGADVDTGIAECEAGDGYGVDVIGPDKERGVQDSDTAASAGQLDVALYDQHQRDIVGAGRNIDV